MGGGRELVSQRVRSGKNDQVPLGSPPAGRHPNAGESRDGGESVIADTHEARGQDTGLCLEGCVKRVTDEAQHEAGLWRGGAGLGGLAEVWALALPAPCGAGLAGVNVAVAQ